MTLAIQSSDARRIWLSGSRWHSARAARSKISRACSRSPRAAASPASFPHASMNDGMALGSSTAPPISIGFALPEIAALGAPAAPAVTGFAGGELMLARDSSSPVSSLTTLTN